MRSLLGRSRWDKIFTFSMVRNPWDRTFSMYHYRRKKRNIPSEWSFRDYVCALGNATCESEYFRVHVSRYGASEYILGDEGEILVDFIARYENRRHDLNLISSRIKIDNLGELWLQKAVADERHYSEYYDSETIEIIRRLYAKDIELFGYEFNN
jgi:hypothetical protein